MGACRSGLPWAMYGYDIQAPLGGYAAAGMQGSVVGAWALAGLVAAIVTFVGWWRGCALDLKRDASLIVLGCVGACLLWSGLQARSRVVVPSAHGEVSVPRFKDAVPRKGRGGEDRHWQLRACRR